MLNIICESNLTSFYSSALNGIYYINKAANEGFYDIDQDVWSELVKESYAEFKHLEGTVVDSNTFDDIFKVDRSQ